MKKDCPIQGKKVVKQRGFLMLKFIYLMISIAGSILTGIKLKLTEKVIGIVAMILLVLGYYLICFGINLIIFMLVSLTIDKRKVPERIDTIYRKVGLGTLKCFLDSMRVKVHVSGDEKITSDKFLFVGNHRSAFDPQVEMLAFRKKKLSFVSKKENLGIPFVGRYMVAVGCLSIDRESASSAVQSINQAADFIKSGKANMGIYPEGRVNLTQDPLLPLRNGALKIAKKADVPIVVATIRGTEHIRNMLRLFKKKHVYIDVVEQIPEEIVKSLSTVELGKKITEIMTENLSKFYKGETSATQEEPS